MALTKEKLISRLQTQVGLSKQESRSTVERVLDIMKESLAQGEDLLISGFGKFSVRQKNARRGRNPKPRKISSFARKGGLQDFRRPAQPHQRFLTSHPLPPRPFSAVADGWLRLRPKAVQAWPPRSV
jgi:integration host factor subunit alpha